MTQEVPTGKSRREIDEIRARRGGVWKIIRAIRGKRPLLTALIVLAAPLYALVTDSPVYDLIGEDRSWRFFLAWFLVLFGVAVRLWGSGNLRKNQEITDTGIYRLVRHPLYLGSLSFFLAYFLTVVPPLIGLVLFAILVAGVYYPTMLSEEEFLALKFPEVYSRYHPPPRLLPDPRRVGEAVSSDRFSFRSAYANLGVRSAWFIVVLPVFLRLLGWVQNLIT